MSEISLETAYKILVSPTSPQCKGKKRMTFSEVAKKFNVSVSVVEKIKSGKWERKMQLHPLINKNQSHYNAASKSAIEEMEEFMTLSEMIGFCCGNIHKYKYRQDFKNQKESDLKKIKTYENYLDVLRECSNHLEGDIIIKDAFIMLDIEFRYK